jgi:hypothetical protein
MCGSYRTSFSLGPTVYAPTVLGDIYYGAVAHEGTYFAYDKECEEIARDVRCVSQPVCRLRRQAWAPSPRHILRGTAWTSLSDIAIPICIWIVLVPESRKQMLRGISVMLLVCDIAKANTLYTK